MSDIQHQNNDNLDYSLKDILDHAFSLFYYHMECLLDGTMDVDREKLLLSIYNNAGLYFTKVLTYSINASRKLPNKRVVDFREFLTITDEKIGEYTTSLNSDVLHNQYEALAYDVVSLELGYEFKIGNIEEFQLTDLNFLSEEELEAFYGEKAQELMGWIPENLISKVKNIQKVMK